VQYSQLKITVLGAEDEKSSQQDLRNLMYDLRDPFRKAQEFGSMFAIPADVNRAM
jgi:hypothetical protein